MRYFCTYFDRAFLPRALALYQSLRRWVPEFKLWALCMDPESHAALSRLSLPGLEPVSLTELERHDPELLRVKPDRTRVEYYFTCSPAWPLFLLQREPEIDLLTYLDADLFFYASPEPLFAELADASIGLIPHRFTDQVEERERFGKYNVGWLTYRRDENALACLRWWREQCLEWCFARQDGDRYADQKYLDQWPERFSGVHVVRHKGANLGPWNLRNYRVTEQGGQVRLDEDPLLFYHFSSFLQVASWMYNTNLSAWGIRPNSVVRRRIVGPYIAALRDVAREFGTVPSAAPAIAAAPTEPVAPENRAQRLRRKLRAVSRICGGLLVQDHLLYLRGQVL